MGRVVLDTGVLVAGFRGKLGLNVLTADDGVALPAVVVAEFVHGILRTADKERARLQREFLEGVTARVPQIPYDHRVTETHAVLMAWAQRVGQPRGAHDLMIAATARVTNRVVLTRDATARFDELPGVQARLV